MLTPQDAIAQANLLAGHRTWSGEKVVLMTCAMTPGSVSLTAWSLTPAGFEVARSAKDAASLASLASGTHYQRRQMLLSDRIRGFFLVPSNGVWNYSFQGVNHSPTAKYTLKIDTPLEFYHELHRTTHFFSFAQLEEASMNPTDREDSLQ